MEILHKNIVYTVDGSGFVGHHSINKDFFSYILNWLRNDERFVRFRQVTKTVYDTLKDNYQFENNVKLPYYY